MRNLLAPLQKRSHPAWSFQGTKDPSRLQNTNMDDTALFTVMKAIFSPTVKYQLSEGVQPLCEDPQKKEVLATMPECNALGIEGRTDSEPQATKAKTRKAKAPSSSGEDEETSESEEESAESSEEESSRSKEDDDGDSDGEGSEGDDDAGGHVSDEEDDDEEEETGREARSPRPAVGTTAVLSPKASPPAPPACVVGEEGGPVGMEVDVDAFVLGPRREEPPQRQPLVPEPSFAASMMPLSPHGSSAGSADMPESLGCKRPRG